MKRYVAGDDSDIKARFDKKIKPSALLPDFTVDYAVGKWVVQVTSLPATERQAANALRESQSKLFEIDVLRTEMDGNSISPVLLINEDVLLHKPTPQATKFAHQMLDRLDQLSKSRGIELMKARTPEDGAALVRALS